MLEMMLFVIAQQLSPQLADDIARQLGLDRIRPGHEKQAVPASSVAAVTRAQSCQRCAQSAAHRR